MTNGGAGVTNGGAGRARLAAFLVFAALGLAFAAVNAASELDERARLGRPVDTWEPWAWELTSLAGFLLVAPAVFAASLALRPPRLSWPAAIAVHLLLSVPASIVHVAVMVGLRHAVYAALGDSYGGAGSPLEVLVYEYRKDLITYAVLALLPHLTGRLMEDRPETVPQPEHRVEVRDGSRTVRLAPADIEWAQAAGNYVELSGPFGTLLHRQTLAALEEELKPHGFVRVHRSRIARAAAIRSVETKSSGDFELTLSSGAKVGGSRRFRGNLG